MTAVALRAVPPTPLAESLRRLELLVSPVTGIVRRLYEPLPSPVEPRLIRVAAEAAEGEALLGAPLDHLSEGTGGSSSIREAARAAAIGETAERYSASFIPAGALVRSTARRLGSTAVAPESFALFAAWQYERSGFPFRPFTADTPVSWVEGFSLPKGERTLVPAQLVYLRDPRHVLGETPIGYATSNGLACGPTLEEAVLAALFEALERDAFLLTWYGRLSLPRLDWRQNACLRAYEKRYFAPTRLQYAVLDLSIFHGVPTALAVVRGKPPRAPLAVGAGCAATVEDAWKKALSEAFAVEAWAHSLALRDPAREFRADFSDVRRFADHVHFYADAARARRADFLDASTESRAVTTVEPVPGWNVRDLIVALTDRLAAVGEHAYGVDVTSPDVRAAGLRVAKVLVPGLCQLDAGYENRFLGGPRLLTAAWRLGLREAPFSLEELNHDPHPFP